MDEEFEDVKGVIRSLISGNRQHKCLFWLLVF